MGRPIPQTAWAPLPSWTVCSCADLRQAIFTVLLFLHLWSADNNSSFFRGLLWRLNEFLFVERWGWSLAHNRADSVSCASLLCLESYATMHESHQNQTEEEWKWDQRLPHLLGEVIPKQGLKAWVRQGGRKRLSRQRQRLGQRQKRHKRVVQAKQRRYRVLITPGWASGVFFENFKKEWEDNEKWGRGGKLRLDCKGFSSYSRRVFYSKDKLLLPIEILKGLKQGKWYNPISILAVLYRVQGKGEWGN